MRFPIRNKFATILAVLLLLAISVYAAAPGLVSYQGRLTDSAGIPLNGNFSLTFNIYDVAVGGTALWAETLNPIVVDEGLFNVLLGSVTPFNEKAFSEADRYIGVQVDGGVELAPRKQIVAVAYAFNAIEADSTTWSGIRGIPAGFADGTDNIGTGDITAVNTSGGLTGGVTSGDADLSIANGGVTSNHIGDGQIVDADIAFGANISPTKINGTAATLLGLNTFSSTNTFDGTLQSCDSVMRIDCNGITLGRDLAPSTSYLLQARRNFNTGSTRYGLYTSIDNVGSGVVYGNVSRAVASTAGDPNAGTVYGSYSLGESDNSTRYGSYATVSARTAGIGTGNSYGVYGSAFDGETAYGVYGSATSASGDRVGVYGRATGGSPLNSTIGVFGEITDASAATGVRGEVSNSSSNCLGIVGGSFGNQHSEFGVYGSAGTNGGTGYGVYGTAFNNGTDWSGYFTGNVNVGGTIFSPAVRTRIDHPQDPENKYLQQALIESPEMKSVYDGVVILDENGGATIELPEYCESINRDFRYQLTAIGSAMPDLHVATEVASNRFSIAGGVPGAKISWQVTGIRIDPWAQKNRVETVVQKSNQEQGRYAHPEVFGQPIEKAVDFEHTKLASGARPQQPVPSKVPIDEE